VTKTRNLWLSIGFVAVLVLASIAGFAAGYLKPVLGLDLEGGVSITLSAPEGTSQQVMNRTLESIRNRVDAFGVGEPDIFVTGTNIEVQIPGLAKGTIDQRAKTQYCALGSGDANFGCFAAQDDAQSAVDGLKVEEQVQQVCLASDAVDVSAVCFATEDQATQAIDAVKVEKGSGTTGGQWCLMNGAASYGCLDTKKAATDAKDGLDTKKTSQFCVIGSGLSSLPCESTEDAATQDLDAIAVTRESQEYCVISSAGKNLGCFISSDAAQRLLQETGQERLLALIGQTARLEERQVIGQLTPGQAGYDAQQLTCDNDAETAAPACPTKPDALDNQDVWFADRSGVKYHLGTVQITGDKFTKATAVYRTATSSSLATGWVIDFSLNSEGKSLFGDITTRLVGQQLAIILDHVVISAPTIDEPITGGTGTISGSFTEDRAKDLATVLNSGSLPVQLERQQTLTVSPTLGKESLHQGIVAGIVGLIALFVYLLFYYRLLGVVAWFGMSIWAIFALTLVSLAGDTIGYALTLAGIAGLVISLGVTADSYIVFFERLKDEVRHGKTARSAVQPAFKRAYRTIVAADIVTGIAAVVLYLTAVSSVRGFALTLGVATLLDLFVVYFFKRPTVFLIARHPKLVTLRGFGLESGVAAEEHEPVAPTPAPVAGGSK
jgi:preprotein translocase subunit SecD